MKYVGPVDGHDVAAVESALRRARDFGGPVIVHAITRKGYGYPPAENDEADHLHAVGRVRPGDRRAGRAAGGDVDAGLRRRDGRARRRARDVVGDHRRDAAPDRPGRLRRARIPERVFDVGIAEQHAVTSRRRAGHRRAAPGGRGLRDVPQPGLRPGADGRRAAPAAGVTFVLDRAGVTGDDGASHNGMWDLSMLQRGARAADRRAARRRHPARGAARGGRASTTARPWCGSPRARCRPDVPAIEQLGDRHGGDRRAAPRAASRDVLLVAVGPMARLGRRGRRPARRAGHRGDRGRPALGAAGARTDRSAWPRSTGWWSWWRTTSSPAASAAPCATDWLRTTSGPRCAASASRSVSSRTPVAIRCWRKIGLTAQEVGRAVVEGIAQLPGTDPGAEPQDDAAEVRPFSTACRLRSPRSTGSTISSPVTRRQREARAEAVGEAPGQ